MSLPKWQVSGTENAAVAANTTRLETDIRELRRTTAPETVATALADVLVELGVEHCFGVVGGAIAPICDALLDKRLSIAHCRHETGAAFAAAEAHFASGRPSVVFVTTGPGFTNALTGIIAARWEGAKVILVSGATPAPQRGRGALQETSAYTFPQSGLFTSGPIFDYAVTIEDPAEIDQVARRLAAGVARPGGFVAHVAVPIGLQSARFTREPAATRISVTPPACSPAVVAEVAALLADEPFAIWVGFGARRAAGAVRALAERTGAPVMCSPRAKGVFPEDHPQFVGVTGFAGDASVEAFMARERPARVLVLGTRLGELSTFWSPELVPRAGFVHVDVDPTVPGTAYPAAPTYAVHAEAGAFLDALLEQMPEVRWTCAPGEGGRTVARVAPRSDGPVRPQALMDAIQHVVVERSDAVILLDAGCAVAWANQRLRFSAPGRYRLSLGWGSMGFATTGVVGAALARGGKAVAVVGDGAMLMLNEVSTAVQYGIPAVWVVTNDAQYGMIEQGMRALKLRPVETQIPRADFVAMARSVGADGLRVARETAVRDALEQAMAARGPFVLDVQIDRDEQAPFMKRVKSLVAQGVVSTE